MTKSNWKHPDWIYIVQEKLKFIDLSKFPSRIWFTSKIIEPKDNKYFPEWALCIDVRLEIKFRDTGKLTSLSNGEGIYLYSEKNFEEIIYVEIERLMCHELKECFQIKELRPQVVDGLSKLEMIIPFDPHDSTRPKIKYSSYDKVDIYRHYPSWGKLMKLDFQKWWKKNINTLRTYYITRLQSLADGFIKFAFVEEVKVLPATPSKISIDEMLIDISKQHKP